MGRGLEGEEEGEEEEEEGGKKAEVAVQPGPGEGEVPSELRWRTRRKDLKPSKGAGEM